MKPTDTSELGLERRVVRHLAGICEHPPVTPNAVGEPEALYAPGGYVLGRASERLQPRCVEDQTGPPQGLNR